MLRKKNFLLASTLLLAPLVAAPSVMATPDVSADSTLQAEAVGQAPEISAADARTNRVLDDLARQLAAGVSDAGVRKSVHAAVGKRFDGDEDALWSAVAEGSTFNAKVAAAANRTQTSRTTSEDIAAAARAYPRLQIAVPVNFDSWNPSDYTPLVAIRPQGVDDTTLDTVTAYDAKGNTVLLDGQTPPKNPVIVVGLNERTDETGKLKNEESVDRSAKPVADTSLAAAVTSYEVRMEVIYLEDDKEGLTGGDAEINMESKGDGCGFVYDDYNWEELNNDGDGWQKSRYLGRTTCAVVFYWWEDDGGSFDYSLEWKGFKFGVQMDNDDDKIGGGRVPYSDFAGANDWDQLSWTALWQMTS